MYSDTKRRRISDDFGETIARFPEAGASSSQSGGAQSSFSLHRRALMARAQLATHQRALWSTYDQLKLDLAGLAAQRVTLWSCWAPRVPRLQVSRGATELLVSYITDMCKRPVV